ncbi:hypothetical protein HPHPH16_1252 [Helicobacter pylori Hp H-16]|nr:hypothetical protein HPHPH16_1252 [Helicobacter pylori Hp H-16]
MRNKETHIFFSKLGHFLKSMRLFSFTLLMASFFSSIFLRSYYAKK